MASIIVLLLFIFLARVIREKANKKLSTEKKAELVDLFAGSRIWNFGLLILVVGLYFLVLEYQIIDPLISMIAYCLLLLGIIVFNARNTYKKLKSHSFPEEFIRMHLMATSVNFTGVVIFFGLLLQ